MNSRAKTHVAVIGAGAFGGWTALYLLRRGARVTLLDAWGPGNSRASSGGESRIIRATYGPAQPYTKMSGRALLLWKEHEHRWKIRLLHPTGVLWMATRGKDDYERGSLAVLRDAGVVYEELAVEEMHRRWAQINFENVGWGIYEPHGGLLRARAACQAVVDGFVAEGGEFRREVVLPDEDLEAGLPAGLPLGNGSKLHADAYVFACGPWLGQLFPRTIGALIRVTRQEILFFGTPPGDHRFSEGHLPVWADHQDRFVYGMPACEGRGFKMADDTRGPDFDPTTGDRSVSAESIRNARQYLAFRFPGMKGAPFLEARVCQYENTPDEHFLIDRHPAADNVWIVGGGSGHGFKHGPALGEMVAELVFGQQPSVPMFRLARLTNS
jgi:sarcosine oxidase